ncbi:MAG: protein kinase [Pseudomonadota bacterium]
MDNNIYAQYVRNFDTNLLDCKLLGQGHNGVIYLLPDEKAIKICYDVRSCKKEYEILKKIGRNRYFPRVYGMSGNYMIRDYVDGVPLKKHIKRHGLDRMLSLKLIELLEEFEKLGFKKLDLRCKDIMIRPDGSLMVIDPKKFYTKRRDFPRHLSKGLYKLGVLDLFMEVVCKERPKLYRRWKSKISSYISEKSREYS